MVCRSLIAQLALAALLVPAAAEVRADEAPAVARPRYRSGDALVETDHVFFLRLDGTDGGRGPRVAAVGTAHSFDLSDLVKATRVDFALGHTGRTVARSLGFLAPPGRPYNEVGGSLRGDFAIYALEAPPAGAGVLEAERERVVEPEDLVLLVGIPNASARDRDEVFGRVAEVSSQRIEVDLSIPYDVRGWSGAPVLAADSRRVIGFVQAYRPGTAPPRVIATPIAAVLEALAEPLGDGAGRPFALFAEELASRRAEAGAEGPAEPPASDMRDVLRDGEPLIRSAPEEATRVHLDVAYPADGAVVENSVCGVFVGGRAVAVQGALRRFDVVFVLDTSASTIEATGADINGNGIVGRSYPGALNTSAAYAQQNLDPGDSILAAEVAAASQLLSGFEPRTTRVAVVTFAGEMAGFDRGLFDRAPERPASTVQALTADYSRIDLALQRILATEPAGSTHMAAGIDRATIELMGLRGSYSKPDPTSEKVVFFFTDGQPTLPYGPGNAADNVRAVLRAAERAERARIRIHSFAIGPDALAGPIATVEMAARTNGQFTPVRHPGDLVNVVENVSFTNLSDVSVRSSTTGEYAEPFARAEDGTWGGMVRMVEGDNEIQVQAFADDGTHAFRTVAVRIEDTAPETSIPKQLAPLRNRMLESCLRDLKQLRLAAERRHAENVKRNLMMEIDRERARARERADQQRKELQIEAAD